MPFTIRCRSIERKRFAYPGSSAYTIRARGADATGIHVSFRTDVNAHCGAQGQKIQQLRHIQPKEAIEMSEVEPTRRELLEDMVRQQPDNTFARYGLAMELAKTDPAAAWNQFSFLLEHHAEYAPTYYHAGAFLTKQGRVDEARSVLAKGIEVTGRQGNRHANGELQAALQDLEDNL
jgi:hypothetical protein